MSGWKNKPVGLPLAGCRFSPWVLCVLLVLWAPFSACSKRAAATAEPALRIAQRNEPATLDPHLATLPDEFFIIRALSEGLLTPAPGGGAPQPAVAGRWNVSPDGRTYTFQLRSEAKWSNGDPVTAGDFVYSIQRALSPALAAPKAALFFPLRHALAYYQGKLPDFSTVGARALDGQRLELTLEEPTADFLALVASGSWIPVHRATVERHRTDWTRPGNFVGNGPFTLTAWRPNQEIIVQRNPAYWDATAVQLPEIRFVAFDNGDTEERAFRAGQVDVTMSVPFSKLESYRQAQPPVLHSVPLHETRYLALNTTRPPLNQPEVRTALALALDRRALVEKVLQGSQQPAYSFVPPGLGGYTPDFRFTEDAAEARQALAEAGFPGGKGFPRLELSAWGISPVVLEAIQQMWRRELGIEVALVQREARTHLAALAAGDYAIGFVTAIPDYDGASDLFADLRSGDPGNYPHWRDPEFDRLVTAARATADPARRLALLREAESRMLGEMPLIPLYFNAQNFLVSPRVGHWQTDRIWTRFYRKVTLE